MKRLFASTLALTIAASGAYAQDMMMDGYDRGELIRTRDITGGDIYTTNAANDEGWDASTVYDGVGDGWNEIGEIEDLILSRDGQLIGIVAEVGGFLDIADKHVVIPVENVSLVAVDDREYAFVTRYNEEQLEELEDVDEGWWD
ncbi:PRC-barrel domain-containing protein [Pseudoroseicyclus sp. CXY001]|uniref:PRC-barrel domain-containing protein n=1 Tax=Pseudoroseicyclus sp. CXY001 TaxID=3242492 RepID=UPI0035714370